MNLEKIVEAQNLLARDLTEKTWRVVNLLLSVEKDLQVAEIMNFIMRVQSSMIINSFIFLQKNIEEEITADNYFKVFQKVFETYLHDFNEGTKNDKT